MPKDFSDKYNTKLSADEEKKFEAWAKDAGREGDVADYDLRGWWKKNGSKNTQGHLTDEFKKPNHPTFSKESRYNGVDGYEGGEWSGDDKTGYKFKASKSNMKNMTKDELKAYFGKVEPGVSLEFPADEAPPKNGASVLYDHPRSQPQD